MVHLVLERKIARKCDNALKRSLRNFVSNVCFQRYRVNGDRNSGAQLVQRDQMLEGITW